MALNLPPRMKFALLPTPVEKMETASRRTGKNIYLKRDDLTGMLLSGNKVRKLEFLIQEALDQGADTVLTSGGLQSNHARATAACARRAGLKCILPLGGDPVEEYDGNLLLDHLLGAEVVYVGGEDLVGKIEGVFADQCERVRARDGVPYVIPMGGSNATGLWGYAAAMEELRADQERLGVTFDSVVVTSGSLGTHAGCILGAKLLGWDVRVVGLTISGPPKVDRRVRMGALLDEAKEKYGLDFHHGPEDYVIIDGYYGLGYALSTEEEAEFIVRTALEDGVILDPVYTGKAFRGMCLEMERGNEVFGENICFVHTGGLFGLFPKRGLFSQVVDKLSRQEG